MAGPLIELDGVEKRYGAHRALAQVSLSIAKGAFIALVGGSGSGKTTLLKTVNGLIAPDAGEVRVNGEAISGAQAHLLRRKIGYVFQEIGLFPHMTVAENIGVVPRLLDWRRSDSPRRGRSPVAPRLASPGSALAARTHRAVSPACLAPPKRPHPARAKRPACPPAP